MLRQVSASVAAVAGLFISFSATAQTAPREQLTVAQIVAALGAQPCTASGCPAVLESPPADPVDDDDCGCEVKSEKASGLRKISSTLKPGVVPASVAPLASGNDGRNGNRLGRDRGGARVVVPKPPRPKPHPKPVKEATRSLDMRLEFEFGQDQMTAEAQAQADVFAVALNGELAGSAFLIVGHTDSIGSYADNLDLSERRARRVVEYLAQKGVRADRLKAVGRSYREPRPGMSPDNPLNRRVEIESR